MDDKNKETNQKNWLNYLQKNPLVINFNLTKEKQEYF